MTAARTVVGVIISILGLLLMLYAGLAFNSLFFVEKTTAKEMIPVYGHSVVVPAFIGLLLLLDGSFVLGLKRVFSLSLHIVGNLVWLDAIYMLNQNLTVPITDISAYQQVFYLVFLGVIFFVVGIIVNDIPQRKK